MTPVVLVGAGALGHGANSQVEPTLPTADPSGHTLASAVHAIGAGDFLLVDNNVIPKIARDARTMIVMASFFI